MENIKKYEKKQENLNKSFGKSLLITLTRNTTKQQQIKRG
jgi:hypothetical protein